MKSKGNENSEILELYTALASGERENALSLLSKLPKNVEAENIIHFAAYGGNKDVMAELLARGFDINAKGDVDNSAQNFSLMQALFQAGIEILERSSQAVSQGKIGFVLPPVPSVTAVNSYLSATPLIIAAGQGHLELLKFLLERGASLQSIDARGRSAFDTASKNNHEVILKVLGESLSKQTQSESELPLPCFKEAEAIFHQLISFRYGMNSPKWEFDDQVKLALFLVISKKSGDDPKSYGHFELEKILKKPCDPGVAYLSTLITNLTQAERPYSPLPTDLQLPLFVWALEKLELAQKQLSKDLRTHLTNYHAKLIDYFNRAVFSNDYFDLIYAALTRIVDNQGLISSRDALGTSIIESGAVQEDAWLGLLHFCATADGSTPSKAWITKVQKYLSALEIHLVVQRLKSWYLCFADISAPLVGNDTSTRFIDPRHEAILKGLIWCAPLTASLELIEPLGHLVERSFRKIPKVGAFSVALGGAGIVALSKWQGMDGIAEICRLKTRIKYKQGLTRVEKVISEVAKNRNLGPEDLEELSVPTFGIQERGTFAATNGNLSLRHCLGTSGTFETKWFVVSNPAESLLEKTAKKEYPTEYKILRQQLERFEEIYVAQTRLLERWLASSRKISIHDWKVRYLNHPLLSMLSSRVIWTLSSDEANEQVYFENEELVGVDAKPSTLSNASCLVSLWHPSESTDQEIIRWGEFLEKRQAVQPFKQAHREVYRLSESVGKSHECERFSGYLLRQHQLAALCRERGWSMGLHGGFDSYIPPSRTFADGEITVTFHLQFSTIQDESQSGIYMAMTSGNAEFAKGKTPLAQKDVPLRVYSEILRDLDLFVSASAIGLEQENNQRNYYQISELTRKRKENIQRYLHASPYAERVQFTNNGLIEVSGLDAQYTISLSRAALRDRASGSELAVSQATFVKKPLYLPYRGDDILARILGLIALVSEVKRAKFKAVAPGGDIET